MQVVSCSRLAGAEVNQKGAEHNAASANYMTIIAYELTAH